MRAPSSATSVAAPRPHGPPPAAPGLEDEAGALRVAHVQHRATPALRLNRHLADFIGENLQHMQIEETQNNAAPWALSSDDELPAIHGRQVTSLPPEETALVVRWMAASLNMQEVVALVGGMQQKAPPPVFEALFGIAPSQLSQSRHAQPARALGRPPVPGLMTV